MFEHLLDLADGEVAPPLPRELPVFDDDPTVTLEDASVPELVRAQAGTAHWLEQMAGYVEPPPSPAIDAQARAAAREAFCAVTDSTRDPLGVKSELLALSTPPAVRHLVGMLDEFDWAYVRKAQEIRGFIVAKLVEHATNPDPKISLSALKSLGTVTEVGAFTTRLEIDHRQQDVTPDAVVARLRSRLQRLLPGTAADVADVADVEDAVEIGGAQE